MRKLIYILLFIPFMGFGQNIKHIPRVTNSRATGRINETINQVNATVLVTDDLRTDTDTNTDNIALSKSVFEWEDSTAIVTTLKSDSIATDAIMYTDTYWDDIRTPSNLSKKVPGKEAKDQAYKGGVVISFEDGADQAVSFNVQLPHGYKLGSDLEFHIHIALPTAGAGAGVENVAFDFTYSWANINNEFPAETTVSDTTDVQDYAADTHRLIEIGGSLDGSAITGVSSMLICSLTRDVSVDDNYADDVYLIELDFHYQFDAPGSWTEYDK